MTTQEREMSDLRNGLRSPGTEQVLSWVSAHHFPAGSGNSVAQHRQSCCPDGCCAGGEGGASGKQ